VSNRERTFGVRVNETTLTCHMYGRGPLCVVHPGCPDLGWEYARIPLAERELTMVYLDPPDTGGDPVDHLRAVVDDLGGEPAFVVGHARGGFAAQRFALRHPSRVAGLILYSTGPYAGAGTAAAALPAYFADYRRREAEFRPVYDLIRSPPRPPATDAPFDLRPDLPSIAAPTLILAGSHDVFFPPGAAEALRAGIPRSRVVTFEQSAHLAHLEEAERFAHVLLEFTRRVSGPGRHR
jgi:proline iminopeptidase